MDTLAAFAAKNGIEYPLLSDEGSVAIRSLGMMDTELEAHHAFFGIATSPHQVGVAYPGVLLLDEGGYVAEKRFLPTYRDRDSGATLLDVMLGIARAPEGPAITAIDRVVQAVAQFDSPSYVRYAYHSLFVDITVAAGHHIFGQPIPQGYVPVAIAIEPATGVVLGEIEWPQPHPFQVEGLDEEFMVYDGTIRAVLPISFQVGPDAGPQTLHLSISYAACRETDCLPPAVLRLDVSIPQAAPPAG